LPPSSLVQTRRKATCELGSPEISRETEAPSFTGPVEVTTWAAAVDHRTAAGSNVVAGAATLTGVNQSTPFDTFTSATGNSTTPSVGASSNATNVVFDVMAQQSANSVSSVGAGQTLEWTNVATNVRGAGSSEPGAEGTVTMGYTLSGSAEWVIGAVSINPADTTAARLESFDGSVRLKHFFGYLN
jgi:hypothetical protein